MKKIKNFELKDLNFKLETDLNLAFQLNGLVDDKNLEESFENNNNIENNNNSINNEEKQNNDDNNNLKKSEFKNKKK